MTLKYILLIINRESKYRTETNSDHWISLPSFNVWNLIFNWWFTCGPKAKLFTKITLKRK